jgi:NADH-quinone oxidoreductase subunit L
MPVYGFGAFGVLALFGRWLPWQGKHLAVLAVIAGFVTFWPVLFDFLDRGVGVYQFPREWFDAGDFIISSGTIVDPVTIVMLALVTFVSMGVQIYSLGYMRHHHDGHAVDDPRVGWYFAMHSFFTASMLTLVLADNLLLLYLAWELVGLSSYLLIGFWWERRSAAEAAKKAFITTRIGDVGLLIGILLLASETGTFDISTILGMVTSGEGLNDAVVTASAFLIFFGAMGKSAQFPLHVWLPDAMEGPSPVSALIHAATMVTAGVFLVARMQPLYEAVYSAQLTVAIIGLTTALMGASLALVATDLKRILAYSTMSHLGFMMLALGAGGLTAAMFHLLTHGVAKAMLFLSAGSIMHSMDEETDIRKMGGLRHRMPLTAFAFIIGALALAGIAPLSAFWSKDEILLAVKDGLNPIFLILFLAAVVLSALYMARAVYLVFFGPLADENRNVRESPPVMSVTLVVLALLTLVIGFIALPLGGDYEGIGSFLYEAAHGPHDYEFDALWTVVSIVLAVGGLLAGFFLYAKRRDVVDGVRERFALLHRVLVNRYYMDHLYQWMIDHVVMGFGRVVAWFDRRFVNDWVVNGSGLGVMQVGKRMRYHVTGLFADYGLAMGAGVSGIALFFWLKN